MFFPRVLHIIQRLSGGGAERQLLALLPQLQNVGIAASVLTIYPCGLDPDVRAALPFPVIEVARKNRADVAAFARLVGAIRRLKPDIVHTHTHSGKYWGRLAALMAGVKTIIHTEHSPCDVRRSALERLIDPWLHRISAKVITFLPEEARVLARTDRIPSEKITVVPNGLPKRARPSPQERYSARKDLELAPDDFAVFLIGRLEFEKNQELALQAIASLDAQVRAHIRLYIAGSGSREEEFRALVRALNIGSNVRFLGVRNDIEYLLHAADLAALTSRFEGMPMVFIEAMFACVPIVSTPWRGSETMLGNGRFGFITPGWDPQDLAREIARAYRNAGARASMAARAYEHACDTYDIANVAQAHRRLYLETCHKGHGR